MNRDRGPGKANRNFDFKRLSTSFQLQISESWTRRTDPQPVPNEICFRAVIPDGRRLGSSATRPARTRGVNVRLAAGVIAPPHGCPVKSGIVATVIGTAHGGTAAVQSGTEC